MAHMTHARDQRKRKPPGHGHPGDKYKIYAESFRGDDHLAQVQKEAQALVNDVLGQ